MLVAIFPLKQIQAFGRGTASRDAFCRIAEKLGLMAIASQTAQKAVSNADLIVTFVTLAPQLVPFLNVRWLKPGAFVTMADLAAPWLVESMSALDRIIVDDLKQEACLPKLLVDPAPVCGDLTALSRLCHYRWRDIQRIYNGFVSRALSGLEQNASTCLAACGALAFLYYGLQDLSFTITQINLVFNRRGRFLPQQRPLNRTL